MFIGIFKLILKVKISHACEWTQIAESLPLLNEFNAFVEGWMWFFLRNQEFYSESFLRVTREPKVSLPSLDSHNITSIISKYLTMFNDSLFSILLVQLLPIF